MMISSRGRYALRAMLDMAEHGGGEWLRLSDIAQRQQLSKKYLESIMASLSRAELVESAVGKAGGYRLTRSPEDYPVGEILRAVEGDLSPISCQSEERSGCGQSCDCDARLFWQGLEAQINTYIDNHTLAQFLRANKKHRTVPAVRNENKVVNMSKALLEIRDLHVRVEEKEILHGVDLTVGQDETHVLMGPNGTGKSTLGYAITGNPAYSVTEGSIIFNGEDITDLPVNERAKKGIFLSFQNPLEVPGVTLSAFIRSALEQKTGDRLRLWDFKKKLKETMALLNMDESYAERDLNVGFSGGEKKKAEILQMLMLEPKLAILDETDSGLDVDAVRTVSEGVRLFRERTHGSLLIITHSTRILEALHVDAAHVMEEGVIVRSGGAELVEEINEKGFGSLKED